MTTKQGKYLAFIYYYSKLNGRAPSEADIRVYFNVTPPSVHQMLLALERRGFISRVPGQARSVKLLMPRERLPELESQMPDKRLQNDATFGRQRRCRGLRFICPSPGKSR